MSRIQLSAVANLTAAAAAADSAVSLLLCSGQRPDAGDDICRLYVGLVVIKIDGLLCPCHH